MHRSRSSRRTGGTALLMILLAGLVGAIVWNLFTWLLGLPSSSSHALLVAWSARRWPGWAWKGQVDR